MKKLLGLILGLGLFFIWNAPVMAKVVIQEQDSVTVPSNEVVNDDLFV
jgi:hypothetical protein